MLDLQKRFDRQKSDQKNNATIDKNVQDLLSGSAPVRQRKPSAEKAGAAGKKAAKTTYSFSLEDVEAERKRLKYRKRYNQTLRSTLYALIVVAALSVLIATLYMPVLRIYGTSMTPSVTEGDIVITLKGADIGFGDIVGFYYENKLLVKRVIAGPGQWVNISGDGTVFVDGIEVDEPYLTDKAYGDVNIELPYQVPDGKYFVMGDHRSTSSDSRNSAIGAVPEEQLIGKIIFCVWPLKSFGKIN